VPLKQYYYDDQIKKNCKGGTFSLHKVYGYKISVVKLELKKRSLGKRRHRLVNNIKI
jgi:hypothetical protein